MDGWEKEVLLMVEGLRADGEAAKRAGDAATAGRRFEQAIDAVRQLCADGKAARDHVIAMRRVLLELDGADCHQNRREAASVSGVRNQHNHPEQARSAAAAAPAEGREDLRILQVAAHKVALATDLEEQGRYEEALKLFQETCAMLTDKDGVASRST
jgi:tetratricopeptide (TPR) repeat protein